MWRAVVCGLTSHASICVYLCSSVVNNYDIFIERNSSILRFVKQKPHKLLAFYDIKCLTRFQALFYVFPTSFVEGSLSGEDRTRRGRLLPDS